MVYRVRGRSWTDLATFVILLGLYVIVYRRFVAGLEFVFHDTMWDHHAFYAVLKQWLDGGFAVGWDPFLNGGEPLYVFSNLFLWAEWIAFVMVNQLVGIPTHQLVNLYFAFVLMSFSTFCFLLASVIFPQRLLAFYAVIPVLFGGLTVSTFAQYMLSPLYLAPLALLAAYLLVRDRQPAWLLAILFLTCVSANHYLPHYLVISVGAFLLVAGLVEVARGLRVGRTASRGHRGAVGPLGVAAALLLSTAALAPALFVHSDIQDRISPTRGNVAVGDDAAGLQPGAHLPPAQYRWLVQLPHMRAGDHSWENLAYSHGAFYVGWIPVSLAFASLVAFRHREYPWFLLTFFVLALVALGDSFILWRLLERALPFVPMRHGYPLALTLTLLLVILSTFGLRWLLPWSGAQLVVCVLTLALCLNAILRVPHADDRRPGLFTLAPFAYPVERVPYSDPTSEVPVDSGPLLAKRATATHPSDDFVLFRAPHYQELLRRDLPFVVGPIFGWRPNLDVAAPDPSGAPNEIANGSFETWRPAETQGAGPPRVPAGFDIRFDGSSSAVGENRDRAWVLDGEASVRMVLPPGTTAKLAHVHPRPSTLRGRFFALSACLASPTPHPVVATVTLLLANGRDIVRSHPYRSPGQWDCLRDTLLVGEHVQRVELVLAVSSRQGAEVYVDRLDLRALPDAGTASEAAPPVALLDRANPNRVRVHVEAPRDGYLVRKENYDRRWSAMVDGRPAPIERYAGAFQAVGLARGPHTVEFTFRSIYPVLMWMHVAAVFLGYVAFYGLLVRTGGPEEQPDEA